MLVVTEDLFYLHYICRKRV